MTEFLTAAWNAAVGISVAAVAGGLGALLILAWPRPWSRD